MRIQGPPTSDVTALTTAREGSRAAAAKGSDEEGTLVKLSDHGQDVAASERQFDTAQAERVGRIKAAVERGDYRVDFDRLTESIIADEVAKFQR